VSDYRHYVIRIATKMLPSTHAILVQYPVNDRLQHRVIVGGIIKYDANVIDIARLKILNSLLNFGCFADFIHSFLVRRYHVHVLGSVVCNCRTDGASPKRSDEVHDDDNDFQKIHDE
jgi:hypothetical protein